MLNRRPTFAEINLDALGSNFRLIQKKIGSDAKILAIVKADAYGHGAVRISEELDGLGADQFGVALVEEGVELRKAGIKKPILILSGIFKDQVDEIVNSSLTPVIFDIETAKVLSEAAQKAGKRIDIHVKIDTGMGRVGVLYQEAKIFFQTIKKIEYVNVIGMLSHLADADKIDKDFTEIQNRRFNEVIKIAVETGITPKFNHLANSAAIISFNAAINNLVRPGIMLYGAYPSETLRSYIELSPVMSVKSRIIQVKEVSKGSTISYGRTWVAKSKSKIATIPIGYADGYNRKLSNRGDVLIREKRAQIAGRVCMDLTMADVTDIPGVEVGDEVVIMGKQGSDSILAEEIAEKVGTISYEIFCSVSKRVPRIYKKDGKLC